MDPYDPNRAFQQLQTSSNGASDLLQPNISNDDIIDTSTTIFNQTYQHIPTPPATTYQAATYPTANYPPFPNSTPHPVTTYGTPQQPIPNHAVHSPGSLSQILNQTAHPTLNQHHQPHFHRTPSPSPSAVSSSHTESVATAEYRQTLTDLRQQLNNLQHVVQSLQTQIPPTAHFAVPPQNNQPPPAPANPTHHQYTMPPFVVPTQGQRFPPHHIPHQPVPQFPPHIPPHIPVYIPSNPPQAPAFHNTPDPSLLAHISAAKPFTFPKLTDIANFDNWQQSAMIKLNDNPIMSSLLFTHPQTLTLTIHNNPPTHHNNNTLLI